MTANFNENSSSYKHQLSSIIQEISREIESIRSKTSRSGRSWKVGDRKSTKQKKSERSSKIFGKIEEVYSRTW